MKLERDELARKAVAFIEELIQRAGLELTVNSEQEEEGIKLFLRGDDQGLLLANNARLLYAFNHLTNQIFYRQSLDGCNFMLDCNNYRNDRAAELRLMAIKAAEKVRVSGMKVSMQPMPSSERRIIHMSLADNQDVATHSEGSGRYRRVMITPSA